MSAARIAQDVLDEIERRVSLVGLVGRVVKLRRTGRGYGGLCPFHQEKTASFTVSDEKGFYHCFGCGAHGDVFRFVQETESLSFPEAVARLDASGLLAVAAKQATPAPLPDAKRGKTYDLVDPKTVGRWIWATSVPARGELVETYLLSRGLDPLAFPAGDGIDALRFHPRAPWSPWRVHEEPGTCWLVAPAMVGGIRDADGHVRGVHVTYLAANGRSKAHFPRDREGNDRVTRKIFGKLTGGAVWLSGGPSMRASPFDELRTSALTQDERSLGKLVVGEGIETTWAVAQALIRNGQRIRAAAALSLDNLEGHPARDAQDAIPLWNPQADFDRACFTIPDAGDVVILVDADMKPIERLVQDARGGRRVKRPLSGLERAELCGSLACQQWRHAGARSVSAVRPRLGMDFNDAVVDAAREAA